MDGSPNNTPKPLQSFPLGEGLELWQVSIDLPKEQTVNARAMAPDTFKQLSENVRREGRLESLPFCALTDSGLEIVSGHHRVRSAKKAGLKNIWVLVDVTKLSRDRILSKQLSHNSLVGADDSDLIAKIFDQIKDSEARIEAFIKLDLILQKEPLKLVSEKLEFEFEPKTAVVLFLPAQFDIFKKALKLLEDIEANALFLATVPEYDDMVQALDKTSAGFEIRSVPTLMAKMAEIVIAHCAALPKPEAA